MTENTSAVANFTTVNLADNRVLVSGTDKFGSTNKIVVDGTEWNELNAKFDHEDAVAAYDQAVTDFLAPLTEAADEMTKSRIKQQDPAQFLVVQEHVCATEGQEGVIIKLAKGTVILRLLLEGAFDRLIWVGDSLEITEFVPAPMDEVIVAQGQDAIDLLNTVLAGEGIEVSATGQVTVKGDDEVVDESN